MIQTQRKFDLNLGVQDYLRIVEMKTGSLFSAAAELAAVISEANPGVIQRFKNFGFQIGTASRSMTIVSILPGMNERPARPSGPTFAKASSLCQS
jgi:hypothetical protein